MVETDTVVQPKQRTVVAAVHDLRKHYGKTIAVDGISLEVAAGQIHGLIGPDGAGKSTLMKTIAGVLTFDGGRVEVLGATIDSERTAERVKIGIGFMPQGLGLNLYPDLSIEENIDFFANIRLVSKRDLATRKERLLAVTRLLPFRDRPMKNLSGGMKQKLGLVCTLIHEPELILLDEPTTGVDPISRRDFWGILTDLIRERNVTALISTAYMDEASRFDHISLLHRGRVLASGTPEEIQSTVPGTSVWLHAVPQMEAIRRLQSLSLQVEAFGDEIRVFVEDADAETAVEHVKTVLKGMQVDQMRTSEVELENVFMSLIERESGSETQGGILAPESYAASTGAYEFAIEAHDLVRDFDSFRAVDHASLRVPRGAIFGLLGANGAGKTTLIKMLTGILPPSGGEGFVDGASMRAGGRGIKEHIGYMSQAFSLYRDLTAAENINLYAGIYGLGRHETKERSAWIIAMAGLGGREHELTGRLPMGLIQRLSLGCALVHHPRILFLDEPTSGVDPLGRKRFWEILFQLSREQHVTILITTHYMSEAERCDNIALMSAGKVICDGSPATLKMEVERAAGKLLAIATDQPLAAVSALLANGYSDATMFGTKIHILSRDEAADESRIKSILQSSGIILRSIQSQPISMEDVFVYRVTEASRQTPSAQAGR